MESTSHQVNFRADEHIYEQVKKNLTEKKLTMSDVLNATLRKIANGTIDAEEFVHQESFTEDKFQASFNELRKEILLGHQAILDGKTATLADVRKEFDLD